MQHILDSFFSNPDILTPRTLLEFFVLMCIFEMIGTIFGYFKGVN